MNGALDAIANRTLPRPTRLSQVIRLRIQRQAIYGWFKLPASAEQPDVSKN